MKRFLLATAAAVALALAVPLAGAQSPATTADPAYTQTTPPVDSQSTVEDGNMEQNAPTNVAPATTPVVPAPAATTPAPQTTAQTTTEMPATTGGSIDEPTTATASTAAPDQHAAQDTTMMSPASLQQAALDAGMNGVPMTAAEVCAPRDVSLGGSRLNHQSTKQLRFAADRASVCEVNQVVISAPGGRGDAVRRVLVEHGFDEADIQVQEASALGVEMRFAGVATSSPEYAAMFNPQQLASVAPSATVPSATPQANDPSSAPEDTTTTTDPMDHGADDPDQAAPTTTEEEATL